MDHEHVWIVRIHYAIHADSAEQARDYLIEALYSVDMDVQGLEASCVDNVEEVALDPVARVRCDHPR